MNAKRTFFAALLVGALFWALSPLLDTKPPSPEPVITEPPAIEVTAPLVSSLAPSLPGAGRPPLRAQPRAQTPSPAAPAPEGNVIEFRVVNGLAVAYGDLLLGKPEEGAAVTRGRYEAPPPRLWDRPEIPYAISPTLPNPERVHQAIDYFNRHTPVSWVPLQGHPDAVIFEAGEEHCYSYLGRLGGAQPIRLSVACQWPQIVHEMMHALGFVHEQSRGDRDQFVEVLWENIQDEYRNQYAIVPDSFMEAQRDTPFDYRSAMLYSPTTFAARPGAPTLRSRHGSDEVRPVTEGLSPGDIQRLKRLYRLN
ncbi:MAG: M12 family metallopeptidase [Oligoflexia bacterium]|nr:M12 family metallopeptidase [Oligoflexia bacterium]